MCGRRRQQREGVVIGRVARQIDPGYPQGLFEHGCQIICGNQVPLGKELPHRALLLVRDVHHGAGLLDGHESRLEQRLEYACRYRP